MSGREDSERKGRRRVKWKRKLWGKQVKINLRREGREGFGKESKVEKEDSVSFLQGFIVCIHYCIKLRELCTPSATYIVFILFTSALFCCCLIYSQHYGRLSCIRKRERKKNTKNNILNINVAGRNN